MPTQLTYPGVYIEEVSSGVHTITGVATSIAAFVGWAAQGPTERAVRIGSFSDYQRLYGPIHPRSYLGYAVQQFFDNGGSDAYVLRVAPQDGGGKDTDVRGTCSCLGLNFRASSPGDWSRFYGLVVKLRTDKPERFTVSVVQFAVNDAGDPLTGPEDLKKSPPAVLEVFPNLSVNPDDARYVRDIVNDEQRGSLYVEWVDGAPAGAGGASETKPFDGGKLNYVPTDPDDGANNQDILARVVAVGTAEGLLDRIDLFNLLCVPGMTDRDTLDGLATFCKFRRAMLLVDCERTAQLAALSNGPPALADKKNAAFYFPWVKAPDALSVGRITDFPPSAFMAGLYARTDATRGVWKAPAGTEATLVRATGPAVKMTDKQNGDLNQKAINCIRTFPVYGTVSWGARTLDGNDEVGSEWKYIPVRRTALFIEESLFRGTKWAVFEPNDEPLWAQLRLNIGAFMHDLFRQGAFQGRTPRDAYFVKCDSETTTQNDINRGVVNVLVGFAPLKPAEFVVIRLTQIAGAIET